MKKDDKSLKFYMVILWVFAFLVIIKMLTLTAKAETIYNLPFHASYINDYNTFFSNHNNAWLDRILTHYGVENLDNCAIFIYESSENSSSVYVKTCLITAQDVNNFVAYNEFGNTITLDNFSDYRKDYFVLPNSHTTYTWRYRKDNTDFYLYSSTANTNTNLSFFGNHTINNYGFTYCYPIYIKGTLSLGNTVVTTDILNAISIGSATAPPPFIVPDYFQGGSAPATVPPTYTTTSYTWSTEPTFDNSSVTNAIGSIGDYLAWLGENLKNQFDNLISNIGGFAQYIGETIQYYGNAIIETLNNGIQNFYDNMVSLFEPLVNGFNEFKEDFVEFADLFIHPFDEEEFQEQIENCQLISQYNELMDNADDIRAILTNAEERDYFVLYIDFENPFADSEHKIIHSEISFTWLKDYRSTYRPFLWLFTMIECFVGGMRLLGGIIGGKAK